MAQWQQPPEDTFGPRERDAAPGGCTLVLESQPPAGGYAYGDTPLPFAGQTPPPERETVPERLRELRRMLARDRDFTATRAKNFYRQALFMADYQDDLPWTGDFSRFYPTYRDLNLRQLRGYFTWRAGARRGEFQPIPASAAYLYLYELLCGVGTEGPEDTLRKLREFETGFLDSGRGDESIRPNLRRWMLEFSILHDLPPETARQAAPMLLEWDEALWALRTPEDHTDGAIFAALCLLGGNKTENSPVLTADPERGARLFGAAWRAAAAYREQGQDLFTLCFGLRRSRPWYPLANAVYYSPERPRDRDYLLDECRSYHCSRGVWQVSAYEKPAPGKKRLQGFLHETDARLRRYLKTGRYLRENSADAWAVPYVDGVIAADRRAVLEASRPRVTVDLSDLDRIRRDAAVTRDSLLTEEERAELREAPPPAPSPAAFPAPPPAAGDGPAPADLPLDGTQLQVLRALLEGRDPGAILRAARAMPSVLADAVNEALFDEFGDTVLLCEDGRLTLVEDYREDLKEYLGGIPHGGT